MNSPELRLNAEGSPFSSIRYWDSASDNIHIHKQLRSISGLDKRDKKDYNDCLSLWFLPSRYLLYFSEHSRLCRTIMIWRHNKKIIYNSCPTTKQFYNYVATSTNYFLEIYFENCLAILKQTLEDFNRSKTSLCRITRTLQNY